MREIKYWQALSEGLAQAMEMDPSVFIMGVGVDDPKAIFGTTKEPFLKFGNSRVFDIPISENAITGVAIGASLFGMRPVMVHARNDFMLLTMDQLVNNAAKWRYVSGGAHSVPITIRAIIGRGWGQGAQHSQSLQAVFAHFPGLKVVMPATPYDAKGLMISSIRDNSPVIFIEHRQLYEHKGPVPEEPYEMPIGKAEIKRSGKDVTIVATSLMVAESLKAADILEKSGISAEVIDLRTINPLDDKPIYESVSRTHRLVVADTAWQHFGVGSEIVARVARNAFTCLSAPARIIASPETPSPVASTLERVFYPGIDEIVNAVSEIINGRIVTVSKRSTKPIDEGFHGPF